MRIEKSGLELWLNPAEVQVVKAAKFDLELKPHRDGFHHVIRFKGAARAQWWAARIARCVAKFLMPTEKKQ